MSQSQYDAVVIGGGFYGAVIAIYLAKNRHFKKIALIEKEKSLLTRASYHNQARVHNGYHYPRSFVTAYRSRINLPRFVQDWPDAVMTDFTKLYAISRKNSKVTARQFERFCHEIGAFIAPASQDIKQLFNKKLIEDVFLVKEYAFNAKKLAQWALEELKKCDVDIFLESCVTSISKTKGSKLSFEFETVDGGSKTLESRYGFNCTYSGLNHFKGDYTGGNTKLKHEITEMALMQLPKSLEPLGITVMDGAFFSVMPFPARQLHTLSHVRYTPHAHWQDSPDIDPYQKLANYDKQTRVDRMVRDVQRYLPDMEKATYVDSLFEVKTILMRNEGNDGRPILFEKHAHLPGFYSVLGGKIDNVYDILERLDNESFDL